MAPSILSALSYFPDKLFHENNLVNEITRRLKPIRAEEAEAKKLALTAKKVFGGDSHILSKEAIASTQAETVKFSAEGSHEVGTLTIHSTTYGKDEFASGHSWISLSDEAGNKGTLATWGNDPLALEENNLLEHEGMREEFYPTGHDDATGQKGLFRDLEAIRNTKPEASRSVKLDVMGMRKLAATIEAFEAQGDKAWTYATPCSTFASLAWETATGERLADQNWLGVSTPETLRDAIMHANGSSKEGVLMLGAN